MCIIATLLVIFGNDINRFVRSLLVKQYFIVRLGIFVLVCAMGYGVATLFLADILFKMLATIPKQYLALSMVIIFILLGLTAEKRKQI